VCGEQLHYSADKIGLMARCRCGRPVRLRKPLRKLPPITETELLEEHRRAMDKRRQILAVAIFVVVTIVVVAFAAVSGGRPSQARQIAVPAADAEP
jgi:hypothetical protein